MRTIAEVEKELITLGFIEDPKSNGDALDSSCKFWYAIGGSDFIEFLQGEDGYWRLWYNRWTRPHDSDSSRTGFGYWDDERSEYIPIEDELSIEAMILLYGNGIR